MGSKSCGYAFANAQQINLMIDFMYRILYIFKYIQKCRTRASSTNIEIFLYVKVLVVEDRYIDEMSLHKPTLADLP